MNKEGNTLATYSIEEHRKYNPLISIFKKHEPIKGHKEEKPLIIYLGGVTGVGKTVLATLYLKERGISYDAVDLGNEAGCKVDLGLLRETLKLEPDKRVIVRAIPKFTTRKARTTELHGIDFYFIEPKNFEKLRGKVLFTYKYPENSDPENSDGALYGVPKSIKWPLKHSIDSIATLTGYNAFSEMSQAFPNAVGILVDAKATDIEAHIKGRAASEQEKESRLHSYPVDLKKFHEHRNEIPYSVFMYALEALRADITPDRERKILEELDSPFRQIKAITKWERYLRENNISTPEPQRKFDYFLDRVVDVIFNGMDYQELKGRVEKGDFVPVIDGKNDENLLQEYSDHKGMSKSLLENIANSIHVTAVLDANGRRSIILSPYDPTFIPAISGCEKKAITELLARKLNGLGTHLVHDRTGGYGFSSLSALMFSKDIRVDEALFVYLSSDHVPITELERPRAINIIFGNSPDPQKIKDAIHIPSLEELIELREKMIGQRVATDLFSKSLPPYSEF